MDDERFLLMGWVYGREGVSTRAIEGQQFRGRINEITESRNIPGSWKCCVRSSGHSIRNKMQYSKPSAVINVCHQKRNRLAFLVRASCHCAIGTAFPSPLIFAIVTRGYDYDSSIELYLITFTMLMFLDSIRILYKNRSKMIPPETLALSKC